MAAALGIQWDAERSYFGTPLMPPQPSHQTTLNTLRVMSNFHICHALDTGRLRDHTEQSHFAHGAVGHVECCTSRWSQLGSGSPSTSDRAIMLSLMDFGPLRRAIGR